MRTARRWFSNSKQKNDESGFIPEDDVFYIHVDTSIDDTISFQYLNKNTAKSDYVIDWGDGSSLVTYAQLPSPAAGQISIVSHTYASNQEKYIISVRGSGVVGFFNPAGYPTERNICITKLEGPLPYFGVYQSDDSPSGIDTSLFEYLFARCYALREIPENLFARNTHAFSFYGTFNECTALKVIPPTLFNPLVYASWMGGYVFTDCFYGDSGILADVPAIWNMTNASGYRCFRNCTNASNYASIPAAWK